MNPTYTATVGGGVREVGARIEEAIETYHPTHVYALFSGGHDSLTSTHISMGSGLVHGVVHINTGIGIEQTREFVRETCRREGWPLLERKPPAKTYEEMVLESGFPGPGAHLYAYVWLKERAIDRILAETRQTGRNRNRPVLFVTGVRSQESNRRMGHVEPLHKDKGRRRAWVAPIHDWTKRQCGEYIEKLGIPRNEVVDILHMSGECLCGAFARANEIEELETWFPREAAHIHDLEQRAQRAGVHSVWGTRPPRGRKNPSVRQLPLCMSCPSKAAA